MEIREYGVEEVKDPLAPELRAELEGKFGELITIDVNGKVCVFRLPTRNEVRRYRQTIAQKDKHPDDEMEKLLKSCVVSPSLEEFAAHMDKYALALGSCGIAFMKGAGFDFSQVDVVK